MKNGRRNKKSFYFYLISQSKSLSKIGETIPHGPASEIREGTHMNKIVLGLLLIIELLSGCEHSNPIKGNAVIDWVDFVKLNGVTYTGLWENVIKDPSDVTDQVVGKVKFKVADVVTNPNYRTKEGDAAFLKEGTKLYRVKGFEAVEIIAAKAENVIGGYRLYAGDDYFKTIRRHYKDVPKDEVERIELYRESEVTPYKALSGKEKDRFIQILESGQDTENYNPKGDPIYYKMVFYTDEPLAYAYHLADDGEHVFFSPWATRIVSEDIRPLIQP